MTLSNADLIDRFIDGYKKGKSTNMEIIKLGNGTAIRGYGFAIYAYRRPDKTICRFGGWLDPPHVETPAMTSHLEDIHPALRFNKARMPRSGGQKGFNDVIYKLSDPPEPEVLRSLGDIPNDTIERLKKGIIQYGGEEVKTSVYNITIDPRSLGYEIVMDSGNDSDVGIMLVLPSSLWYAFIEPIVNDNKDKLKFMYELSKSNLDPDKHTHFNFDKLRRVEKQKCKMSEYEEACTKAFENSEIHHIGGYTIFFAPKAEENIAVTEDGKCYRVVGTSNVALGKAIQTGKMTKPVRGNMHELSLKKFSKDFLTLDFPRDTVEYLPKSVRSHVVKEKLRRG